MNQQEDRKMPQQANIRVELVSHGIPAYQNDFNDAADAEEAVRRLAGGAAAKEVAGKDGEVLRFEATGTVIRAFYLPTPESSVRQEMPDKRIMAVFQPQAWINDDATDIDGREDVDVTERVLRLPLDRVHALQDYRDSTELLVDGSTVAIEHDGPFTVKAVDSICTFFGVKDLSDITEDMLVAARQAERQTFEDWVAGVEREVGSDVDGESYRRYYNQGMSPSEAVRQDRLDDGLKEENSTGAAVAVSGTPDLSNLEAEVLLAELRRRGLVVSAWGIDDATGTLENDAATESLTESQFAQLEEKLFEKAADTLEDILANRGNDHINDIWSIHGQKLIAVVLEQDAAPHAPSLGL
ncbi:hypothetical protein [Burkholderia gladioli]|uniref:hypothetical protein n=1 Tax=Burkholderia gladioli TaxID=28095 RepID=UPI00164149E1|nr:hypothetical protein [Burkholderia gladioli]